MNGRRSVRQRVRELRNADAPLSTSGDSSAANVEDAPNVAVREMRAKRSRDRLAFLTLCAQLMGDVRFGSLRDARPTSERALTLAHSRKTRRREARGFTACSRRLSPTAIGRRRSDRRRLTRTSRC